MITIHKVAITSAFVLASVSVLPAQVVIETAPAADRGAVLGDTLHVPGEYPTIKTAIQAAVHGDVVEIADGTYTGPTNKNLNFDAKMITVRSASGDPARCVIDCEGYGRGFAFDSGEGPNSIVKGLTITNGNESRGGGVYCASGSSPTFINCTITGNWASVGLGGGVFCDESSPVLVNCTISRNAANCYNGGVDAVELGGGGVYCFSNSSPSLINCTITGNSACYGGAIYSRLSSPILTNCILWDNAFHEIGVHSTGGVVVATYCNIRAGWSGTGNIDEDPIFAFADDVHLMPGSPCIDAGTNSPPGGLPVVDQDGNARLLDGDGDGVAVADIGVFESNSAAPSIALGSGKFEFSASEGGDTPPDQMLSLRNSSNGTLNWQITGQPAWLAVYPAAGSSSGEVDQVTLGADVSGLKYGTYTAALEIADPQGLNSPREVTVELHVTTTFHVPGEQPTIQQAISAALVPGDVVELADGIYTGSLNTNLDFWGKPITLRSASGDPTLCVIDCAGCYRNGLNVIRGEGPDTVIKGLTITNADASDVAVYCSESSPTLINCIISNNGGRGLSCQYSWAMSMVNCTISGNDGGGISVGCSTPTFTNCIISDNSAAASGGGISCGMSSPTFVDCTISGNSAIGTERHGGGVSSGGSCGGGRPTFVNCTFSGNSASGDGGGIFCQGGLPALLNCTISGNAARNGGAIHCLCSSPALVNCMITGNSVDYSGGTIDCDYWAYPVLANCIIWNNDGSGVHCLYSSPELTNCTVWGNDGCGIFASNDEDTHPVLSNCILWGNAGLGICGVPGSVNLVSYCNVEGGWPGAGNFDADPLFVSGPGGCFYLSNTDAGLPFDSPCLDTGSDSAANLELDTLTTRRDEVGDSGTVDVGYHYPVYGQPFIHGDLDRDGDIDLGDFGEWIVHMTGPCGANPCWPPIYDDPCSNDADLDDDGDVDLADFAAFQMAIFAG